MRLRFALPDAVAELLAEACRAEALTIGVPMAVALADAEGGAQWFARMDGTLPASTELAMSKAYTAAALRMPTHELGLLAQPGAALYGIQNSHGGRIVVFGGGFPLRLDGRVVGALGVSGGTVEEDMRVAAPALGLLAAMEEKARLLPGLNGENLPPLAVPQVMRALRQALAAYEDTPAGELAAVLGGVALALT
ncbi:MAG: heme-binding protein [Rhodospirillaceae bacterium]